MRVGWLDEEGVHEGGGKHGVMGNEDMGVEVEEMGTMG